MADNKFSEIGTSGLNVDYGFVSEAYNNKLYWPTCAPLYNRIWRSDPEVTIARTVIEAFASKQDLYFETPQSDAQPTDDDERAVEFGNQVLDDMEDGIATWHAACLSRVLFYGFGWWEVVPGVRSPDWRPPDGDPWRSEYKDNLIGYRRLAFRHYNSFREWDIDDATGRLQGMRQDDPPNPPVTIPLDRSLHITFGDNDNPEGLATMEALWRLERVKYGLEVVFGIGAEHTAGYLSVKAEKPLSPDDNAAIKAAARAIMSAQEGNYAAWPDKVTGELIDTPFSAGQVVLDAIRYFGILKLALINMQWMALGTMSPYGSYSAMSDASQFFVSWFNAVTQGIVRQADKQIGRRLFEYPQNKAAFPNMTRRPVLRVSTIDKDIPLAEMASFIQSLSAIMPLGDDDLIAIRKRSGFLPDVLPEDGQTVQTDQDEQPDPSELPEQIDDDTDGEPMSDDSDNPDELSELAFRPFIVSEDEQITTDINAYADDPMAGLDAAMRRFKRWAQEYDPLLANILSAKVVSGDEQE